MAQPRHRAWNGVRTRVVFAAADPDQLPRPIEIPAGWNDEAAAAVAALARGGASGVIDAARSWLGALSPDLASEAIGWLLARRAAPDAALWGGGRDGGFSLNLAAFDEAGLGLDAAALRRVAARAIEALSMIAPDAPPVLRITDLDGMLAAAGMEYDSDAARDLARSVCAMLRDTGATLAAFPDPTDALLGAEASGIAPRFGWLDPAGKLSRGATALLAARGMSAEAALAACLTGRAPLPTAGAAAHGAMRAALRGLVQLPDALAPAPASRRRELPSRPGGYAGRVTLGGHRLFVRTAEYADGALAEVSLGLPRESAAVRGMADALGQIASLALQHGAPVAELIEAMVGTRFGPAGAVDGDPDVTHASSPLDYLARSLAAAYAPELRLPPVETDDAAPALPLEMPRQARPSQARPTLRIVA